MQPFIINHMDGTCRHELQKQDASSRKADATRPYDNPDDDPLGSLLAPMLEEGAKQIMTRHLREALRWIKAAQAELTGALTVVDVPDSAGGPLSAFSRKSRMARINLHFQIDKLAQRGATLLKVLQVFKTMESVFQRPAGLWGPNAFEVYRGKAQRFQARAFTSASGFFRPGETDNDPKLGRLRLDTIYFMPQWVIGTNVGSLVSEPPGVIVHELAHFVGAPQNVGYIDDHGYGAVDDTERSKVYNKQPMSTLTPGQRITNATTYANFAFQAATGSSIGTYKEDGSTFKD